MKKNFRILKKYLFSSCIYTLLSTSMYANGTVGYNSNSYNPWVCKAPFEIGATLIYFMPSIDDTHFVLSSIDNTFNGSQYPNGKRHQNNPSFSPGVRVAGGYIICPNTSCFDLQFTYLQTDTTSRVTGDFLYDTNGFPGFGSQDSPIYSGEARSKNWYTYYGGDLTYNRNFRCFSLENFTYLVGFHTTYIEFKERSHSVGGFADDDGTHSFDNNLRRRSKFWGIGPLFGLEYQFLLPCHCLPGTWALNAATRGALLCGTLKSDLQFITLRTGPIGVAIDNGHFWRVIPAFNADVSISYQLNCFCMSTTVELGYEFIWYNNVVNKITGVDTAFAGDTIDNFQNLSFQGPYLGLNFAF